MIAKVLLTTAAVGLAVALCVPTDASAAGKKYHQRGVVRDCTPYNGPYGYYGNPWCDGGWKYAEDYPPGAGRYYDLFELPQLRRHYRRRNWD